MGGWEIVKSLVTGTYKEERHDGGLMGCITSHRIAAHCMTSRRIFFSWKEKGGMLDTHECTSATHIRGERGRRESTRYRLSPITTKNRLVGGSHAWYRGS